MWTLCADEIGTALKDATSTKASEVALSMMTLPTRCRDRSKIGRGIMARVGGETSGFRWEKKKADIVAVTFCSGPLGLACARQPRRVSLHQL